MSEENRFSTAIGLLQKCAQLMERDPDTTSLGDEIDAFIATVHPAECGPFARTLIAEPECATCKGDHAVCASIPGLRHCEAAMRGAPERSAPSEIGESEHNDTFRLEWLFKKLNDSDIKAKVQRASDAHANGGRFGIRMGDFRSAIDHAIHEEQAEKDAANG